MNLSNCAATTNEEIVVKTPFGEAHIPRLEMPKPPDLSGFALPDLPPALARLAKATAGPQMQLNRAYQAMSRLQEDVEQSAQLMFEESDACWDQYLDENCGSRDGAVNDDDASPDSKDV
jgi:hypothetical protein